MENAVVTYQRKFGALALSAIFCAVVAGCGGGSGGGVAAVPAVPAAPSVVSGVASLGPITGAMVCAYNITAGVKGTLIGTCATNTVNGQYTLNLGAFTGPAMIEATGGTYVDEGTGLTVNNTAPVRSIINVTAGNNTVAVTALTEMATQHAIAQVGGITPGNITTSITKVQDNTGVANIVTTLPPDALNVPPAATIAEQKYALANAAVAEFVKTQPAGTTIVQAVTKITTCLKSTAACGTGVNYEGYLLNRSKNDWKMAHAASPLAQPAIDLHQLASFAFNAPGAATAVVPPTTAAAVFIKHGLTNTWTLNQACTGACPIGAVFAPLVSSISSFVGGIETRIESWYAASAAILGAATSTYYLDAISGDLTHSVSFAGVPASGIMPAIPPQTVTNILLPKIITVGASWVPYAPVAGTMFSSGAKISNMGVTLVTPGGTFTDCIQVDHTWAINLAAIPGVTSGVAQTTTTTAYYSPTAGSVVGALTHTVDTLPVSGVYDTTALLQPGWIGL